MPLRRGRAWYRLRKSAWGKGYATEGSRALIGKGFTEFGVQRVVAEAMAVNMASRRVMEKAGLRLVRTFHQPWPYPIDGDQFGTWSTRWTRPIGSNRTWRALIAAHRRKVAAAGPVTARRIIAAQIIDARIAGLIDGKAGLAARALDGSDQDASSPADVQLEALATVGRRADGRTGRLL